MHDSQFKPNFGLLRNFSNSTMKWLILCIFVFLSFDSVFQKNDILFVSFRQTSLISSLFWWTEIVISPK